MNRALPGTAVLGVLLIAGCGGESADPPASTPAAHTPVAPATRSAADEAEAHLQAVNRIAACMKKQGFTYIPQPLPPDDPEGQTRDQALNKRPDANETIAASLSPARRTAYYLALTGWPDGRRPDRKDVRSEAAQRRADHSCTGQARVGSNREG